MRISEMKLPIQPAEARAWVQKQTDSFGIFIDSTRINEIMGYMYTDNVSITKQVRKILHAPNLFLTDHESIISILVSAGVPKALFIPNKFDSKSTRSKSYTFTMGIRKRIIETPSYSEDVRIACKLINEYVTNSKNLGTLNGYSQLAEVQSLSKLGRVMRVAHPTWEQLATSRIKA